MYFKAPKEKIIPYHKVVYDIANNHFTPFFNLLGQFFLIEIKVINSSELYSLKANYILAKMKICWVQGSNNLHRSILTSGGW